MANIYDSSYLQPDICLDNYKPIPICGIKPSAVAGCLNNDVLTAFDAEMFQEQLIPEEIDRNPGARSDKTIFNFMQSMGAMMPVCGDRFGHWEKGNYLQTLRISSVELGVNPGDDAVLTLHESNMWTPPANAASGVTNMSSARTGYIAHRMTQDGKMVFFIIKQVDKSTNPFKITVAPWGCTTEFSLADCIKEGDEFVTLYTSFAKCSCIPEGILSQNMRYQNCLQIIKAATCACATDLAQCFKVRFLDVNGNYQNSVYVKMQKEMEEDIRRQLDMVLLLGQKNRGNVLQGDIQGIDTKAPGASLTGTVGLIPYAMANGFRVPTEQNEFSWETFEEINMYLESQNAPSVYCVFVGPKFHQAFEKEMLDRGGEYMQKDFFVNKMFQGCEKMFWRANFGGFRLAGRTFIFKQISAFGREDWLGGAGMYPWFFIGFPMTSAPYKNLHEDLSGGGLDCNLPYVNNNVDAPPFMIRYKAKDSYSRFMRFTSTGDMPMYGTRATRKIVDHCDFVQDSVLAEVGGHFSRGNLYFISDFTGESC